MVTLLLTIIVGAPTPFPYQHDFVLQAERGLTVEEVEHLVYPCPVVSLRELELEVKRFGPPPGALGVPDGPSRYYIVRIRSDERSRWATREYIRGPMISSEVTVRETLIEQWFMKPQ